ncbi:MAG: acyl-CoA dehydrogenase, partial [Novosphingobium sp.]
LRQMFLMMNEARISVGLGAAALGYRSHRLSVDYARERVQGRPIGERGGAPVPIIAHPDVRRMLLQQKCYVEGALALCLYCARLVDDEADPQAAALLGLLTPVAKTWPSEYGLAANDIAIQIHGGYGYTRDFDVEQLWRDNRLNPIHEGTTGVQAIDLLGRKILRDGSALPVLERAMQRTMEQASTVQGLAGHARALSAAWLATGEVLACLKSGDERSAFDNATPFLWAFGHVVVAWLWLDQAVAAAGCDTGNEDAANFVEGKLRACRYFFEAELPKVEAWLSLVGSRTDVAAAAPAEIF